MVKFVFSAVAQNSKGLNTDYLNRLQLSFSEALSDARKAVLVNMEPDVNIWLAIFAPPIIETVGAIIVYVAVIAVLWAWSND